jgi:hypothetical protein
MRRAGFGISGIAVTEGAEAAIETGATEQAGLLGGDGIREKRGSPCDAGVHDVPGEGGLHFEGGLSARMLTKPINANSRPSARIRSIVTMPMMKPFMALSVEQLLAEWIGG